METPMRVFEDLPGINWCQTDYPMGSGYRTADINPYMGDVRLGTAVLGHQTHFAFNAPLKVPAMTRYLEGPDSNPLYRSLRRVRHQVQLDSPELRSAQAAEPYWPFAQDHDRQSSPDSTTRSCSSGTSFAHFAGEDHILDRSYCLSPRSNMFSWSDDHVSGFERSESRSYSHGSFADTVACISPCDLQHYPDAPQEHTDLETLEIRPDPRARPSWPAHYPAEVAEIELGDADENHDSQDGTTMSENETLIDAEGDDIDENEQDDFDDDTYSPRKTRASTMNARRRSGPQQKLKSTTRGHKRSTSTASASNKVTKTTSAQTTRARYRASARGDASPPSPITSPTTAGGGGGRPNSNSGVNASNTANAIRPFPCPLAPYNCPSAFGSKNEWKRHISSQHLRLGFWRCDLCVDHADRHNDFNRKDLFTQHLRRMHGQELQQQQSVSASASGPGGAGQKQGEGGGGGGSGGGGSGGGNPTTDAEAEIVKRCYRELRQPPMASACLFCSKRFDGPGSWEDRVEHVGKHFETERKAGRDPVPTERWTVDQDLQGWLLHEGMIGQSGGEWEIRDGSAKGEM
ncbi:MAG: hypothetical protein Q9165_007659 [Trypethelium subeluteriae]